MAGSTTSQVQGLSWSLTPKHISIKTAVLIHQTRKALAKVAAVPIKDVSCSNVIKPLSDLEAEYSAKRYGLEFYRHVHPDEAKRRAGAIAYEELSAFKEEMLMNKAIRDRLKALSDLATTDQKCGENGRYLKLKLKDGELNGIHLDKAVQKKVQELEWKEHQLNNTYISNLYGDRTVLKFTKEQLDGLPDDFFESLEKSDDRYRVNLRRPYVLPILSLCRVSNTRRAVELAYHSRCEKENPKILQQLVDLRREKAALLGYDSHAAFVFALSMAESPANVKSFLSSLAEKLKPLAEREIQVMLKMKKDDCEKNQEEFDGKINAWDMYFYLTRIKNEMRYEDAKFEEYFPLETVTKGLLGIYGYLLGLRFDQVENPEVWHEDVILYKVFDAAENAVIGHIFLDRYAREGKFRHHGTYLLIPGCLRADGLRQTAAAAMVVNFAKPTATVPSLLTHGEVKTYVQQFSQLMHHICAEVENSTFATPVECEFGEAPAKTLEHLCWEEAPLKLMSGHYKTKEKLPEHMSRDVVQFRNVNAGLYYLQDIILATFDLELYTMATTPDIDKLYSDCYSKILGIQPTPGTCMIAQLSHIANGYAHYYECLRSDVIGFDMFFSRFKKEGMLSPKVGLEYRRKILRPGGSIDAINMLKDFLGREPNQDAFLAALGVSA